MSHVLNCTISTSADYSTHFVVTIYNSNNVSAPVVPSTWNSNTLQGLFQSAHDVICCKVVKSQKCTSYTYFIISQKCTLRPIWYKSESAFAVVSHKSESSSKVICQR